MRVEQPAISPSCRSKLALRKPKNTPVFLQESCLFQRTRIQTHSHSARHEQKRPILPTRVCHQEQGGNQNDEPASCCDGAGSSKGCLGGFYPGKEFRTGTRPRFHPPFHPTRHSKPGRNRGFKTHAAFIGFSRAVHCRQGGGRFFGG